MAKNKTIAIFTSNFGHASIGQAITEIATKSGAVVTYKDVDTIANIYTLFYQFMPGGTKIPWRLSTNQKATQAIHLFLKLKYEEKIEEFYLKHKPDLCINTHFMFSPILSSITKISETPYINIVTDPKTIHPLLIDENADSNFCFDTVAKKTIRAMNTSAKTDIGGWLVRDKFEQPYNKHAVRKKLHLDVEKKTILIASGSEGTNAVLAILPTLIDTFIPLQIIVACGENKLLFNTVKTLAVASQRIEGNTFIPLHFTHDMHTYMQAADIVVGKAGPNTLFETTATLTPFFAITHIAGQEDGNLDLIKNYKLGFVQENPLKAASLLKKLIKNPQELEKLEKPIQEMATYNKKAKQLLSKKIVHLMTEK